MPTKQKVAIEIQIIRSSDTKRTVEEIAQLELRLSELNAQIRQARKEGNADVYTRLRVDADAVKTQIQEMNKGLRQQKRDFESISFAPGSYQQLSRELSNAKREFQALSREAREGIAGQDLLRRIKTLDGELKTLDASVGTYTRNVGNYASAFRALGPALAAVGIGVGLSEIVQLGRQAVSIYAEFQQEIATLGAISGATGDELTALRDNAQRLGETTQFTAKQVAELQTNFARTGFNPDQIIKATEATVNLAIATQENVVTSSDVVGSAIKGFSLAASDAVRVTDVMTTSFNSSRLALDKWAEAQKFVAPVASSLGVSIEGTAAAMAALADAGLEGSNIGTGLRRVMVDLGNENSKLAKFIGFSVKSTEDFTKAMEILADANLGSTESFELVGRIGQTALLNLANRGRDVFRDGELVKGINTLTKEFENAAGSAARVAKIVGDTLAQDILKAKSAVEGLQINFVSLANNALRSAVQGFTSLVDTINRWVKIPASERLEEERQGLNRLVTELTDVNQGEERRADVIAEIQAKYPQFLESINIETASNDELRQALGRVNDEYTQRILLQRLAEDVEKRQLQLDKARNKEIDRQVSFADALANARRFLGNETLSYQQVLEGLEAQERRNLNVFTTAQVQTTEAQRLRSQLVDAFRAEEQARDKTAKAQDRLNEAERVRVERLELLRQQFPELTAAIEAIEQTTNDYTRNVEVSGKTVDELRAILANLKDELEDTPEGTPLYEELETQISEVEEALRKMGAGVGDAGKQVEKLTKGSLKALRKELSDLQSELDNTPAASAKYIKALEKIRVAENRLNEELRLRELFTFSAEDFIGSPEDLDAAIAALESALSFHDGVKRMKEQANIIDVDANVDAIKEVEAQRIISLQRQLRAGEITEKEFERARVEIATQTEFAVLDARLAAYEVGSTEYLQLVQERADKELEIERGNAQRIAETQQQLREQIQDVAIASAGAIGNAIIQIEQNNLRAETDSRLAAIEEEYTARIEAAQGNATLVAQLEEEKTKKIADVEREAARTRKEIAKKEAIIQAALAAIRTTANLGFPAAIPALIGQAIALAAQLAVIDSQQFERGGKIRSKRLASDVSSAKNPLFAKGGKVRGKTHDQGGEPFTVRSTGQRVELEGGEAVINRRSMASKDNITVTGTPAQIASQINAYRGYGDHFTPVPSWVKPVKFDRGGVVFAAGGAVPQSPQFVNPNTFQGAMDVTLTLTDDQIDRIATRIADKTAKETGQAVKTSINDANRLSERQKFATAKTGIK